MSTEPTYPYPPAPPRPAVPQTVILFAKDDQNGITAQDVTPVAIPLSSALEWRPLDQKADPSELTSEGRCLWITEDGEWCFCSPGTMAGYHPHKDRVTATPAWWLPMDALLALPRQAPVTPPTAEEACLAEFYAYFNARYPEADEYDADYARDAWMAARGMNGGAA